MPPCPAQGVPFGKQSTYELFRHYYALPSARDQNGCEVAAVRGVLASVLGMIKGGATHIAVATDHVIESFRNGLWPSYPTELPLRELIHTAETDELEMVVGTIYAKTDETDHHGRVIYTGQR